MYRCIRDFLFSPSSETPKLQEDLFLLWTNHSRTQLSPEKSDLSPIINESTINTGWSPLKIVLPKETFIKKKSPVEKKMTNTKIKDQTSREIFIENPSRGKKYELREQPQHSCICTYCKRIKPSANQLEGMLTRCKLKASRKPQRDTSTLQTATWPNKYNLCFILSKHILRYWFQTFFESPFTEVVVKS